VVISNGDDTISRAKLDDAIEIAQRTGTTIYAISTKAGFVGPVPAKSVNDVGETSLIRLCEETGGEAFFIGDMLSFERSFQAISETLRTQYVLTYRPANQKHDGAIRKIEVRFADEEKGKGMKIHTKSRYRAITEPVN
jgi:VWFA-related protein